MKIEKENVLADKVSEERKKIQEAIDKLNNQDWWSASKGFALMIAFAIVAWFLGIGALKLVWNFAVWTWNLW